MDLIEIHNMDMFVNICLQISRLELLHLQIQVFLLK